MECTSCTRVLCVRRGGSVNQEGSIQIIRKEYMIPT